LLIYKFESYELFKNMVDKNNRSIVSSLLKAQIHFSDPSDVKQAHAPKKLDMSKYKTQKSDYNEQGGGESPKKQEKIQPVRVEKKVGRNEPCPCGSGKKYKHCHGKIS
jgi:preprotein translocase subunit SecA